MTSDPALLLIDLDGTVHTRDGLIPGARDAVDALRADGHTLRFLTNTDSAATARLLDVLAGIGLAVAPDELFTSVTAVEALLRATPDATILPVTNDEVATQLLTVRPSAATPTHVIVGDVRDRLSYELLDTAFAALRAGAALIALQKGRFFLSGGTAHLDTGAIVAALEYAASVEAVVAGKPSTAFLDLAVASAGATIARERVWVVGDDVTTDIRMGRDAGARTVLVRTGKYALQRDLAGTATPDHELDSIADLPDLVRAARRPPEDRRRPPEDGRRPPEGGRRPPGDRRRPPGDSVQASPPDAEQG